MTLFRGGLVGLVACGVLVMSACGESEDAAANEGDYQLPERHVQGCSRLCEREAEGMCPNETTFQVCVDECIDGIQVEACASAWDPVLDCVLATTVVTCSSEGTAVLPECIPPYLTYLECVDAQA